MYSQKENLKTKRKLIKNKQFPKGLRGDPPAFYYRRAIIYKSKAEKETSQGFSIFGYRNDYNK